MKINILSGIITSVSIWVSVPRISASVLQLLNQVNVKCGDVVVPYSGYWKTLVLKKHFRLCQDSASRPGLVTRAKAGL